MNEFITDKLIPLCALGVVAALAFTGKVTGTEALAFIAGLAALAPSLLPGKAPT
jgi:hypothetical protein